MRRRIRASFPACAPHASSPAACAACSSPRRSSTCSPAPRRSCSPIMRRPSSPGRSTRRSARRSSAPRSGPPGVLIFWSARQDTWVRARVAIPAVAVVVATLLAATLRHLEAFSSPLGLVWIEVYALIGPVAAVLLALQLAAPGADHHSGAAHPGRAAGRARAARRRPRRRGRAALPRAGHRRGRLAVAADRAHEHGARRLAGRDRRSPPPTSCGSTTAPTCGGALLSVTVLAACQLLALALHPAQLDAADPALWAYAAAWAGALALGLAGVRVAHADGRYRVVRGARRGAGGDGRAGVRRAGRRPRDPVELVRSRAAAALSSPIEAQRTPALRGSPASAARRRRAAPGARGSRASS